MKPSLLVKDLGGLALYYPGQAVVGRVPRGALIGAARVGGGIVRRMGHDDMRDELARIFAGRPDYHLGTVASMAKPMTACRPRYTACNPRSAS